MNNNQLMNFVAMKLRANPQVANTPIGQQFVQILQSGNDAAGQQLAMNICNSLGISKEQALQDARNGFHI